MGNQELLDCFCDYTALKARHSYGPQGHRGMGALIFEESTIGYLEAMRLHKHFKEQGRDREAWDCYQNPFLPGGKRQLYGYLASKEDLDIFNKHSRGKKKLKFEMRSYQEMVESKIKHINDDSRNLDYYKSMVAKEQIKSQVGTDSLLRISEKLSLTTEENRVDQQNKEVSTIFLKAVHVVICSPEHKVQDHHRIQTQIANRGSLSLSKIIGRPVRVTMFCENAPTIWDQHRLKGALKPGDPQGLHSEESIRAPPS
ncbi:Protein SGS3 [Glycine soja]|uniref:Protein SGS3 n=1 Tax=Glycine soja TaxID=3848 RepID=A0A445FCT9_GLYSO|nr:Protein SGS3 [Glycine soja]